MWTVYLRGSALDPGVAPSPGPVHGAGERGYVPSRGLEHMLQAGPARVREPYHDVRRDLHVSGSRRRCLEARMPRSREEDPVSTGVCERARYEFLSISFHVQESRPLVLTVTRPNDLKGALSGVLARRFHCQFRAGSRLFRAGAHGLVRSDFPDNGLDAKAYEARCEGELGSGRGEIWPKDGPQG